MADLSRRVEIIFDAQDRVSQSLTAIESSTSRVTGILGDASSALLKTEAAVVALGVAYLAVAVNESAKFQSAQADLRKALDDSDPPIESFTARVDELAVRFGQAGDVIVGGIANFRNAGFTAQESADLIEQALNLQIAGDIPLEQTFESLITIIRGFQVEVADLPRALEAINNVTQASGTNVGQLAEALGTVGAQANLAGLSIEQTVALIAPIVEVTQSGAEAGTALSIALGRLAAPAGQTRQALNTLLGDGLAPLTGELRPAGELLVEVAGRFGDLTDAQQLTFASQLFGQEQAKRLVVVLRDVEGVTELTNVALEQTGSVTREVEIRLQAFQNQVAGASSAFSSLNRVVGDQLRPSLGDVAGGLTDVFVVIRQLIQEGRLDEFFAGIRPQIDAFADALQNVAANLPEALGQINFDGFFAAFDGLGDEIGQIFQNLFGKIDVSTPQGLADTLQSVVDSITGLANVTQGIISQFQVVFRTIGELVNEGTGLSAEAQQNIGQLLGAAQLVQELGLRLGGLALVLNQNREAIDNVIDILAGGLGFAINALQTNFDLLVLSVANIVTEIAKFAQLLPGVNLSSIITDLETFQRAVGDNLTRNATEARQALNQMGQGLGLVGDESETASRKIGTVEQPIRDTAEQSQKAAEQIGLTADEVDKLGEGSEVAGGKIIKLVEPTRDVADATKDLSDAADPAKRSIEEIGDAAGPAGQKLGQFGDFTEKTVDAFSGLNRNLEPTRGTFSVIGNSASEAATKLEDSAEASDKLRISLAQIASDERIKNLEIAVEFNIAQIEADTERFKSTIDGLNTIFEDTGDILSDALGPLAGLAEAGTSEFTAGFQLIQEIIQEQNRIRQQIADAEVRNLDAQTDLIEQRVRQARRGDALIRIEAPPEIEEVLNVVFNTIMGEVQVRANDQGLEILNTIPVTP